MTSHLPHFIEAGVQADQEQQKDDAVAGKHIDGMCHLHQFQPIGSLEHLEDEIHAATGNRGHGRLFHGLSCHGELKNVEDFRALSEQDDQV